MTTDLEGAVELDEAHRALTAASRQLPELWEQPNKAAVGVVVKPQHLRLILAALKAARHDYHTKTREADDALASITRERDAMREALTPSADTKAAYIGEIKFSVCQGMDDDGCEIWGDVTIPWDATKATMAMIAKYAALVNGDASDA